MIVQFETAHYRYDNLDERFKYWHKSLKYAVRDNQYKAALFALNVLRETIELMRDKKELL